MFVLARFAMNKFILTLFILLAICLEISAKSTDTIILTGTFDTSSDRRIVIQPPDVAPSHAVSSKNNKYKLRNALLIGLLVPGGLFLLAVAFLSFKTVRIRKSKQISFPSFLTILSPTGKWPHWGTAPAPRPRFDTIKSAKRLEFWFAKTFGKAVDMKCARVSAAFRFWGTAYWKESSGVVDQTYRCGNYPCPVGLCDDRAPRSWVETRELN
ncbi:hypothetical protein M501DRAFT_992641 [Patellaria atrata CBS 101060]|uniref:Uncharacterized protein n=1 Tax=Patellaria atrata CBS 101060 TaxID=1346257 RepID=A0A9P4SBN9_9PEZI|nr:hypothetical protein M501DRAFT_992641 [Patellaria atrata CBS 101060]